MQGFDSRGLLATWLHWGDVPLGDLLRVYFLCEMLAQDGGYIAWLAWDWLNGTVEGKRGPIFRELREGRGRRYHISSSSSLLFQSKLKNGLVHLHVSTLLIEITDVFEHTFALFIVRLLFLIQDFSQGYVRLHHYESRRLRIWVFRGIRGPSAFHHLNPWPGVATSPLSHCLEIHLIEKFPLR